MRMPAEIPELGKKGDRPRLNKATDPTTHRLTPLEGFVLSRVDGASTYEEICLLVIGVGAESTLDILRRFRRDGLILAPDTVPPLRGALVVHGQKDAPPPEEDRRTLLERLDDHSPVDPADLIGGPDLSTEMKMRIVRLHRRLKTLTPHEMLGMGGGASPGAIKRAYYAASKEFHPDRYYGKDMGVFREKLGEIFARLTEAFQRLEDKK